MKSMMPIPLLVLLLVGFSCNAFAKIKNNQFIQQHWGEDQGLPVGDLNGMVQDDKGYIWLASLDGLIRFDGEEFTQFDTSNSDLVSNRLTTIRKTKDDVLWLSSDEGELIRFKDLQATTIGFNKVKSQKRVFRVTPKGDENIAYGTLNGVILINGSDVISIPLDSIGGEVKAIHWPKLDSLWVATNQWLYHAKNPLGNIKVMKWPLNQEALTLQFFEEALWMGTKAGLHRFNGESFDKKYSNDLQTSIGSLKLMPGNSLLINSEKLWLLKDNQLNIITDLNPNGYRLPLFVMDKQQQFFYQGNNSLWLNGSVVANFESEISDLMLEKSGGIIISTKKHGLYQLQQSFVKKIGIPENLPGENIYPVFQSSNQSITISENSLGAFSLDKNGLFNNSVKNSGWVNSIEEINHSIWLVGSTICIINQLQECIKADLDFIEEYGSFSLIYQDVKGQIWLAGRQGSMWKFENNNWQLLTKRKNNWIIDTLIQTVLELKNGDILFGTNGNGIIRVRNNQVIDDSSLWGLQSRYIRSLLMVDDNYLLVGTQDQGLCRVDLTNKSSLCINKSNNLTSISLHYLYLDKLKRVWWSSNRGVFWQKLSSLMDVFNGKLQKLPNGGRYDKNNGMRNSEANGRSFPAGFVDENDKMWIPTQQGLAIFDTTITQHVPTADALVQGLFLEGSTTNLINNVAPFEAEERSFQIKLTALSFYNPKNIEFRYRETTYNLQSQWIELGNNRLVNITHLSSGNHHFEFSARNTEGKWQNNPAVIDIKINYFWYERSFVQLIGVLLLFALIATYIRLRNRSILQRSLVLEQMVKDRTYELKQLSDKRTDFFANISHELRTPLTLILGPIDDALIQQKPLDLDELKSINYSAKRMKRLVDQMLDLQKLDAGKLTLHKSQQQIVYFLKACIEPFTVLAKHMDITLLIDAQSEKRYSNIWVSIDVEQMVKVIANLLSNAFKFTPEKSTIEIKLNIQNDQVAIKILDQGPGIPQGANERIFNRFSQETSDQYNTHQGTGIGLALVKEVVKLHAGQVKASNRNKGGARFTVTLPIIQQQKEKLVTKQTYNKHKHDTDLTYLDKQKNSARKNEITETKENDRNKQNTTVLIVEDNKDLQKYIASHLQKQFEILIADDGQQGLKMAQVNLPDIIVSDVMMPNMDGFEMAKALRQDKTTNFIPFLFLTAKFTAQDEIHGLSLGADDYISKPFSGALLNARIQTILDSRKRLRTALQQNQYFTQYLSKTDSLETKAINAIYKHISEPDFNIDALAKTLCMSRSKLYRSLKSELNTTASNLIRTVRMTEAKKLLQQNMGNVREVCCAVGYTNLSSFSRLYKETHGHSPSSNLKEL